MTHGAPIEFIFLVGAAEDTPFQRHTRVTDLHTHKWYSSSFTVSAPCGGQNFSLFLKEGIEKLLDGATYVTQI